MKDESMEVVAVEISEVAKKNLKRLIKNNIKNKVQITDNFDFQKYQDDKKTLVIMDCEGSEMDYLKKFSKHTGWKTKVSFKDSVIKLLNECRRDI